MGGGKEISTARCFLEVWIGDDYVDRYFYVSFSFLVGRIFMFDSFCRTVI